MWAKISQTMNVTAWEKKKTDTKALSNNNNNPKLIYEKSLVTLTEKSKKYFKSKVV